MRVIILGFSVDIQESSRSSCHMNRLAQRSRSPVEFMRSSAARSPILNRPCPRGVRSRQLRSPDGLPSGSQQLERSRGRPSSRSRSRSSSRLHIRQPSRRRTGQCSESRSRQLYHLRVPSHRQGRSRSHQRERLRSRERSRSRSTPRSRESRRSVRTQNYPSCHRGRLLDNGSRAVECILHGIDDRSIRLGAEAVQYDNPDKLLAYLRNTRNSRTNERKIPRNQFMNRTQESSLKQMSKGPRCFNCKQEGHTVSQCPQPVKKCGKCQKVGHDAEQCYSKGPLTTDKNVLRVTNDKQLGEKYLKTIEVNGIPYRAFLDFGSDCCMIRISDFIKSHNQYETDALPTLKGFGNSIVNVLGRQLVTIKIDEVEADVELFVVPDEAMHVPVMIGQTFTEQPHIVVHKTSDKLELLPAFNYSSKHYKIKLFCKCETLVSGTSVISVYTEPLVTGDVYIEGGLRLIKDTVFSVLAGLFSINDNGEGELLVSIASGKEITINKDYLLARGYMTEEYKDTVDSKVIAVNNVTQGLYQPIRMDEVKTGPNISSEEKEKLLLLLNNFRNCFAASLAELEALFGVRPTGSTESKIIHDLDKNRANIRDEINTHIEACQQNQKESFDKHRCIPPKYNIGDLVRVERQVPATGQSKKLVPKFQGPYRIASILDHDRFAIEDTPLTSKRGRSFSTIVAIDKIKPWLNFNRPHVSGTYSSESDDEESRE
ncbi:unnamed protein product, partial [Brenthis ino]